MLLIPEIFNISRCSLDDGPGVRTVVYFKGCNMRCKWCHNPESHSASPEISYAKQKCVGCGRCAEICPDCHQMLGGEHIFKREKCIGCGKCADICVAKSLTVVGEKTSPSDLLARVMKDEDYFKATGGGVTLSGGECLLYPEFAAEFLKLCAERGINALVESAFNVDAENIEKVMPYVDEFYVDLKLFDSEKHKEFTGVGNEKIKENILKFANEKMTIRIPLIPGVNDDDENLSASVQFAKKAGVKAVQLLKYNYLYASKYELSGKSASLFAQETQSDEYMEKLCEKLDENGYVFFR
ncbi:MAG: glycyl-radical enzyme activating protein [Clostridia bacterium]|nr:glycyl-radical enzyme activating protein [Clostridia bacterium]